MVFVLHQPLISKIMRKIFFFACLFLAACATAAPVRPSPTPVLAPPMAAVDDLAPFAAGLVAGQALDAAVWQTATRYQISLTLDPSLQRIDGRQTIRYTNRTGQPLPELYLRLYPNLTGGSIALQNVRRAGQDGNITPTLSAADSVARLPLEPALAQGETAEITLDFVVAVPTEGGGNYNTFVFDQNILALAHFYPFVPVYDAAGWHLEIPSTQGDIIYGESSFYTVDITAPADQVVVTTGQVVNQTHTAATQTITLAAGPVRDFYLISSADFVRETAVVEGTTINHYGLPDAAEQNQSALQTAVAAVSFFNEAIGPYPFTELDLAASPTAALGVEYPGLVVNATRLYKRPTADPLLATTTVHEVAHQWFYSTIGNDQLSEPWLDEALAQLATLLYFEQTPVGGASFLAQLQAWGEYAIAQDVPIGLPVAAYESPALYGTAVYGRGPLFFVALREQIGEEAFSTFLHNYYTRFQFGVATSAGLQTTAEAACGCDLTELFVEWGAGGE